MDVTRPFGSRIIIKSLADGSVFDENQTYNVAMTSYRASGGGGIMREGAGVDTDKIHERVVEYYPEIREILYDYLLKHRKIDPEVIGDRTVVGEWRFIPESIAQKAMDRDMTLLFQ